MKNFDRVVYLTTNLINGKKYVGQDSYNRDWYLGSGKLLKKAIEKYGIQNFKKEILCKCSTKEELDSMEKFWIKKLDTINEGYNITSGGSANSCDEYVNTMSNSVKGENNPMYGKSVYDVWAMKYGHEKAAEMWKKSNEKRSLNGKNKGVKPVEKYDASGNLIATYNSMSEASRETNININSISAVCRGRGKTAGGFVWSWKKINKDGSTSN